MRCARSYRRPATWSLAVLALVVGLMASGVIVDVHAVLIGCHLATRARVRGAIEHVFAAQKCRLGLVERTVGLARAITKVDLANLVTNLRRLVWFETRPAPA